MTPRDDLPPDTRTSADADSRAMRAGLMGLAAGTALGAVVVMLIRGFSDEPQPVAVTPVPPVVAPVAPTTDVEPGARLLEAQQQVRSLEEQLAAKEKQITDIGAAAGVAEGQTASTDLVNEVATIKANLDAARVVRDRLKTDLKAALAQVEVQVLETAMARGQARAWKTESIRESWNAFTASSATQLCDHGTRTGVDKCQSSLKAWFTEARFDRYSACLRAGGAEPSLFSAKKNVDPPANAVLIENEEMAQPDAWYVLYCDPKLPERNDPLVADGIGVPG